MFSKILIANRGEIACRIMRTARELNIATVAVYSDADCKALHVREADEAVRIGPAAASESYLNITAIVDAAIQTQAQAVHPGYGFLSENPDFADAVESAGLIFIGPSADAMRAMGLKDAAKSLMENAGVNVVPGYHGDNQDIDFLALEAGKIGYPVLIKARAGGGGKGMRLVEYPSKFSEMLASAISEGQSSFGDGHVLLEKFVSSPRHIEVQVFGDNHGNVIHLFERDCSLQRRHQKVIEEAPAPGMTSAMRDAMGQAAVRAAKAVNYSGAGTVEFIVDGSDGLQPDKFWFMEMNTRLQVEHPVTEMITGLDLVKLQLEVAAGGALPFTQAQVSIDGWAMEARIYAEDPADGFLPSAGSMAYLRYPNNDVRMDLGVGEGDEVSPHYDPMIAKLIVKGKTRDEALKKMGAALKRTHIAELGNNIGFLSRLCTDEDFGAGKFDTGLIGRKQFELTQKTIPNSLQLAAAAVLSLNLPSTSKGWRIWGVGANYCELEYQGLNVSYRIEFLGDGLRVISEDFETVLQIDNDSQHGIFAGKCQGKAFSIPYYRGKSAVTIFSNAHDYRFNIIDPLERTLDIGFEEAGVRAPMSGLLKILHIEVGDKVSEGQPLGVVEAMKMEHILTAPKDGEVAEIFPRSGEQVDGGSMLINFVATDHE